MRAGSLPRGSTARHPRLRDGCGFAGLAFRFRTVLRRDAIRALGRRRSLLLARPRRPACVVLRAERAECPTPRPGHPARGQLVGLKPDLLLGFGGDESTAIENEIDQGWAAVHMWRHPVDH